MVLTSLHTSMAAPCQAQNLGGWAVAALCRAMSLDNILTFLTAALLERQASPLGPGNEDVACACGRQRLSGQAEAACSTLGLEQQEIMQDAHATLSHPLHRLWCSAPARCSAPLGQILFDLALYTSLAYSLLLHPIHRLWCSAPMPAC